MDRLVAALQKNNALVRIGAARSLGKIRDPRAIPALLSTLKDPGECEVHRVAAGALGMIGTPKAERALLAAIEGGTDAAPFAVDALVPLAGSKTVAALTAMLKHANGKVRAAATSALGRIGDPHAVEPLISILSDELHSVRFCAVQALGAIGDLKALEPLVGLICQFSRTGARSAMPRNVIEDVDKWVKKERHVLEEAARAVEKLDVSRAPVGKVKIKTLGLNVAALLSTDTAEVNEAVVALGRLGDPRAVGPLVETFNNAYERRASDSRYSDIMVTTARGLAELDHPKALEALTQLASKMHSETVIEAALDALMKRQDWRGTLKFLLSHEGREGHSLNLTGRLAPNVVDLLLDTVRDSGPRPWLVFLLGQTNDKRVVPALAEALKAEDRKVRYHATNALSKIGDPCVINPLIALLSDKDTDVRETAAKALQTFGWKPEDSNREAWRAIALGKWEEATALGIAAVQPLIAVMGDGIRSRDFLVLGAAAEALGKIGDRRAVEPLLTCLDHRCFDSWALVRIIRALGQLGDSRAVDSLIPLLAGPNPSESAAEALGLIGDVRAIQSLVEAVSNGASESAILAIETLLAKHAARIPAWDLSAIAKLPGTVVEVIGAYVDGQGDFNESREKRHTCEIIKRVAREEIARRTKR